MKAIGSEILSKVKTNSVGLNRNWRGTGPANRVAAAIKLKRTLFGPRSAKCDLKQSNVSAKTGGSGGSKTGAKISGLLEIN